MVDLNDKDVIESLRYLLVSTEEKLKAQARPYDPKKHCWVQDHREGYIYAELISTDEKKKESTIKTLKGETVTVKSDKIQQMNPPKYEKCDDMADMTYLNDATVLHNLRARYMDWLIYTYSGLFCVVINPYKRLPVYTMKMVDYYRGKKKNEVPPHLYYVADNAYQSMLRDRENQSMLITGESGAGKTENTKKVIQYFAFVAVALAPKKQQAEDANKASLEDQIVSANPVLEAYGNAKTTRNNNSSRFGKFIRIHFAQNGAIAGADIESYLLEKSRVTFQQPAERNYHIFYQLLSPNYKRYHADMLCVPDAKNYYYISQGVLTIDNVNDAEEMKATDEAFDILNFSQDDKLNLFKLTGAIMHWGNSKWKQRPREEQAESDGTDEVNKVATLLGVNLDELLKGLLKPRIKVGNEYVNKGQNKEQVINSIGALSKSIYSRCFNWLVDRVNQTLDVKTVKRAYFIGVLDIAGFEIFDYNGFEQLCINYTNEKLQQFFNYHMFVLEQEEYAKEGIVWEMMNFGMDLQGCIDLIEKPLGIMSILEEECIVPKGTDKTFQDKLYVNHLGKNSCFGKPKLVKGKAEAHFDLHHYAGTVSYSVTGWLEKNKDPINITVATLFKSGSNTLLALLYHDMGEDDAKSGKAKKGGSMMTISAGHREQLNKLMHTLHMTSPHFVRCIIPNEIKTGGIIDAHLVMHQLHCNGVLEGIRICRKGFPNRILYSDFKQRYFILAPNVLNSVTIGDSAKLSALILKEINFSEDNFKLGKTKIFFKAGMLASLEESRDVAVSKIIVSFQSHIRCYLIKIRFSEFLEKRRALTVLQKNVKSYLKLRNWNWFHLYGNVKPLLQNSKREEERKQREEKFKQMEQQIEADIINKKDLEEQNTKYLKEKNDLLAELKQREKNDEAKYGKLESEKVELERFVRELEEKIAKGQSQAGDLTAQKKMLESDVYDLKSSLDNLHNKLNKSDIEIKTREAQIRKFQDEIAQQNDTNVRLIREKKRMEELNSLKNEELKREEEKYAGLNRIKLKIEQNLDDALESLEKEKKMRVDVEKSKRKLETDLKSSQSQVEELERIKKDYEESLKRKDAEANQLMAKIEDEAVQSLSYSKRIKDLQMKLEEAEKEIENEIVSKVKIERQKLDLAHELDELNEKLLVAGGLTNSQAELNKKKESELAKLKFDLEETNLQREAAYNILKKKHSDTVTDMNEQIDSLQKAKTKLEKDKQQLKAQSEEARSQAQIAIKNRLSAEKLTKQLEQQIQEISLKLDESNRTINEINLQKSKMQSENSNLLSQIDEFESHMSACTKQKQQLISQIDSAKRAADEESRGKAVVSQQFKNLNSDFLRAREQLDEESSIRSELQKNINRLNAELQMWRSKYETEGLARAEDFEEVKKKLTIKLAEAEEQNEQVLTRCHNLEKNRCRLQNDIEDLMLIVDKEKNNSASLEKKQKQFDKLLGEWKQKCDLITGELESSQRESRHYTTEIYRLRSVAEESNVTVESMRRENSNLTDQIKELMTQLNSGGKSYHDVQKTINKLEDEKQKLQINLEETELLLEQELAKSSRLMSEVATAKSEIDKRIKEKDEEFENTRRNHMRTLESIQATLEAEVKGRADATRNKKKLESDLNEIEMRLNHTNAINLDLHKENKRLQQNINELILQIDDEQKQKGEYKDAQLAAERRVSAILGELDEFRALLDHVEKCRKTTESNLNDAIDRINELNSINSTLTAQKRKSENDLIAIQSELNETVNELKNNEEKNRKASMDVLRITEELRQEQEHNSTLIKLKISLEQRVKELQNRLDEVDYSLIKDGKRAIKSLEQKINDLVSELEHEKRRHNEALTEIKKNERKIKELIAQSDEETRSNSRLQDIIDKLQSKARIYKKQAEDAEEIASINLSKFRKVSIELQDALERATEAEGQIAKVRALNRNSNDRARQTSIRRSLNIDL